ncbi:MAG: nuclease [Rhodospirillaceae bacterium]|mgnify:CR=1 FL=1|nr:nuclease [Rhodospirillaceae bacterium]|tara:strand:- start:1170 stop:1616 length:447 start_codon:yes stop_codon:yes gene_type:complete
MKNPLTTLLTFSVFFLAFASESQAQTQLQGPVTHVRDGDTIKVGPVAVRLEGISAPELKEKLGHAAKIFMRQLVFGRRVLCRLTGSKTYDRFVGICFLDGKDIGEAIIARGLALDCPRFSKGRYNRFQTTAAKMMIKLPNYCRTKRSR